MSTNPHYERLGFAIVQGLVALLISTSASATTMPTRYQGVWAHENCHLPRSESEVGEFPFLVVTPSGYESHEVSCSLKAVSKGQADTEVLTFSCSSEGEQSRFKEVWAVSKSQVPIWGWIFSEEILVRKGGEYGEGKYKRCALSAAPRETE